MNSFSVKRKRSVFEIIVVAVVVMLSLVLGFGLYAQRSKVIKSRILIDELSMLRSATSLFLLINKRYPDNINDLLDSTYIIDSEQRSYVDFLHKNEDHKVIDPFGNAYAYETGTGWISSVTPGYSSW